MATTPQPTAALKALAKTVFLENKLSNGHKSVHDQTRKQLFTQMVGLALDRFTFETKDQDNKKLVLEVELGTPQVPGIDTAKLRTLVTDEVFMAIITATKKAVEDLAGKETAVLCEITKPGTTNVTVKPAK